MEIIDFSSALKTEEIGDRRYGEKDSWGNAVRIALELLSEDQREKMSISDNDEVSNDGLTMATSDYKYSQFNNIHASNNQSSKNSLEIEDLTDIKDIVRAIHKLIDQESCNLCAQLELLVRFDDLKGWRDSGSKNCAAWMNAYLQVDQRTAWERLRVGRKLRELPIIHRLFECGRLSWSKVRLLTRIAEPDNEKMLAHASIDSTVTDVQRLCEEYRWSRDENGGNDAQQALLQQGKRSLIWQQLSDGSTLIRLTLPPEQAQNFLHAIEHCEDLIYQDETEKTDTQNATGSIPGECENRVAEDPDMSNITTSQRRADAAVLLAERSLAFRGEHLSQSDRFQVVLNIDNKSLMSDSSLALSDNEFPTRKPFIEGIGPIPEASARRIACDCNIIKMVTENGEPLSIGRKQRIWSPTIRRAILTRDRHCQFPGCTSHRYLHIHHIKHWVDGGETSVDNGVCLCHFHHQLVHLENYSIARPTIETNDDVTTGFFSSAKKKLLPTRCRFVFTRMQKTDFEKSTEQNELRDERPRGDSTSKRDSCCTATPSPSSSAKDTANVIRTAAPTDTATSEQAKLIQFAVMRKTSCSENNFYTTGVASVTKEVDKNRCDESPDVYKYKVKLAKQLGLCA